MKLRRKIVPVDKIPLAVDTPTDNLLDIFRLITQMERICTEEEGIGLSAVQIGVPWKLFIVQRNNEYEYYLNCEYIGVGDKKLSLEGCLSLRDSQNKLRRFEVQRYSEILVKGKQLKVSDSPSLILEDISRVENGFYAVVFQHEIDHFFQREKMIDTIGKEVEIEC